MGSAIVSKNFVFFVFSFFRFLGFWGFLALAHARARARIRPLALAVCLTQALSGGALNGEQRKTGRAILISGLVEASNEDFPHK